MGSYWGFRSRAAMFKVLIDDEEGERPLKADEIPYFRDRGATIADDIVAESLIFKRKCLTKCMRGRTVGTLYSVWEHTLVDALLGEKIHSYRFIRVDLIKGGKLKGGDFEWGYKPMDESCGPCEVSCPLSYLDMVPDPGGYATEWREKVREWHAKRKASYKPGLGEQIELRDGLTLNRQPIKFAQCVSQRPLCVKVEGYGIVKVRKNWVVGPAPKLEAVPA